MRSYIKLIGPPVLKGIRALEKIAVEMPEVCIMHQTFVEGLSPRLARDVGLEPQRRASMDITPVNSVTGVMNYFSSQGVTVSQERCESIISKSSQALGEYDFFFEWFEKPSLGQLSDLIKKIDLALGKVGCFYRITSLN